MPYEMEFILTTADIAKGYEVALATAIARAAGCSPEQVIYIADQDGTGAWMFRTDARIPTGGLEFNICEDKLSPITVDSWITPEKWPSIREGRYLVES